MFKSSSEKELRIQAQTFQKLITHFQSHTEVQNIDLMNLADFCRNCLAKWYVASAEEQGVEVSYDEARKIIYGMPYSEWKEKYQKPASEEQLKKFSSR